MWVLGQEGAQPDHHGDVVVPGEGDELIAEAAPLHRRLRPDDEQDVGRRQRRRPDVDGRPDDLSMPLVDHDERTDGGEVGERLGIELGDLGGIPLLGQHADRPGRTLAGVVPSREGEQQDRSARLSIAEQSHVVHLCVPRPRRPLRAAPSLRSATQAALALTRSHP